MKRGRPLAYFASVGGISIVSLALLNIAADKFPHTGLATLRDYVVRRNG